MYRDRIRGGGRKRRFFFFIPLFVALFFGLSAIVMLLWNAVLPQITSCKTITYWQSAGLLVLSKLLFGGFHFRGTNKERRLAFRDKIQNMTEEEKEKFRSEWRKRCTRQ